ncbi:MAG: RNA polymerase sigma factor [Flavobacteriaceae bacterium]|nr:RNA polymerase sigma factor [Flavobacteriaceae bacterium]
MKVIQLYRSEKQLVAKALEGSRRAQKDLYELHAPKMLSVCRYYIKDIQDAEDVMISAFFKGFQNLKTYQNNGNFEGWIRRIMVNESISFLRKQKEVYLTDEIEDFQHENDDSLNENFNAVEIQQLIDDLPEGYKMVFVLYAIEGYKHQEIAAVLNISENTSKSQLFKARKLLQQKITNLNAVGNGTR